MAIHTNVPFFKNAWDFNEALNRNPVLNHFMQHAYLCMETTEKNAYSLEGEMPILGSTRKMANALAHVATDISTKHSKGSRVVFVRLIIHAANLEIVNLWVDKFQRHADMQTLAKELANLDKDQPHKKLGLVPRFPPDRKMSLYSRIFTNSARGMHVPEESNLSRKISPPPEGNKPPSAAILTFPAFTKPGT